MSSVPVLASRIPGSVGLLGASYGGYFAAGDTVALRRLMTRLETDHRFTTALTSHIRKLQNMFHPRREREAWKSLLRELAKL